MDAMIGLLPSRVCRQLLLLAQLSGSFPVLAQTASTGALAGIVVDASGGRIADASVEANDPALGVVRLTSSSHEGRFVLPFLPPGDYLVLAHRVGLAHAHPILVIVPVVVDPDDGCGCGGANRSPPQWFGAGERYSLGPFDRWRFDRNPAARDAQLHSDRQLVSRRTEWCA